MYKFDIQKHKQDNLAGTNPSIYQNEQTSSSAAPLPRSTAGALRRRQGREAAQDGRAAEQRRGGGVPRPRAQGGARAGAPARGAEAQRV